MKKSLLLATMFLSGVVQAETYVCTSTYGDQIVLEQSLGMDKSGATFIADIDKGLRSPKYDGTDELYSGECGKYDVLASGDGFSCTSKFGDSVKAILINISDLTFTASSLYRDHANVFSGKCVAI
ncbi:hypothetical protein N9X66_09160 [Gammaproteobacteria bacterium]|nr:hypothetical protein [Gammaproteobacteria bacterium]